MFAPIRVPNATNFAEWVVSFDEMRTKQILLTSLIPISGETNKCRVPLLTTSVATGKYKTEFNFHYITVNVFTTVRWIIDWTFYTS